MGTFRRIALVVVAALVATFALSACVSSGPDKDSPQGKKLAAMDEAYAAQEATRPYPATQLKDSLERKNLSERLLRTNNPNLIGYVYVLTRTGEPLGYFVIKGKVSSTESQMNPRDSIIDACDRGSEYCPQLVDAPGDDGSYGPNEGAVFFFTADGVMVTWNGEYVYSDAPLALNVPNITPKR